MTGYGSSERTTDKHRVKVEFKSLNGKYLELNLRLPKFLGDKEAIIRNYCSDKLVRGSVLLSITMERIADAEEVVAINEGLAEAYFHKMKSLSDKIHISLDQILPTLLNMPDVLKAEEGALDDKEWDQVLEVIDEAATKLNEFRSREGENLKKVLSDQSQRIEDLNANVSQFEDARRQAVRDKILQSIRENFADESYDKNRFEQELIYYQEKLDISEERDRLRSHCELFSEELNGQGSGKKLGFIAQEMGREINTMGSKANYTDIQKLVVDMKEHLEKIKEQVLNVV